MRTVAPLQVMNLSTSVLVIFFLSSFAWFVASYIVFRDILIGWPILGITVAITGLLGWWLYRSRYHAVFSWDEQGFELTRGRGRKRARKWRDFSRVSLVHEGYGRFSVRLYEDGEEHLDIPVSALKLPVSEFRFEVMDWVKGKRPVEQVSAAR